MRLLKPPHPTGCVKPRTSKEDGNRWGALTGPALRLQLQSPAAYWRDGPVPLGATPLVAVGFAHRGPYSRMMIEQLQAARVMQ